MVSTYLDAAKPRSDTVPNHEDGQVYALDKWARLNRYLVLGTEQGSYYARPRELSIRMIGVVRECLVDNPDQTVETIATISESGIAPKQDPAILALAIASIDERQDVRDRAFSILPRVCRYGTPLFHFVAYRKALQGNKLKVGRMYRRALANWYDTKASRDVLDLAREVTKYQSRDGVAHRDVILQAHPKPKDSVQSAIYDYVVHGTMPLDVEVETSENADVFRGVDRFLSAVERVKLPPEESAKQFVLGLITEHRLTWEMLNTGWLNDPDVWAAMLPHMPMEAMIRNLPKMTAIGLLAGPGNRTTGVGTSANAQEVISRLTNKEMLRKARIHPIKLLIAMSTYARGYGDKGSLSWNPVHQITEALDDAIYLSFAAVEPTGKKIRCCVDTSGSMDTHRPLGGLTARDIATLMGLVTFEVEPNAQVIGFCDSLFEPKLKKGMRLKDAVEAMKKGPSGGTYCSLPVRDAMARGERYDAFAFYTDSETFDGRSGIWVRQRYWTPVDYQHPVDDTFTNYLDTYRQRVGRSTRSIVVACAANDFSLNDPLDPLGLDIAGFSPDVPALVSSFTAGRI